MYNTKIGLCIPVNLWESIGFGSVPIGAVCEAAFQAGFPPDATTTIIMAHNPCECNNKPRCRLRQRKLSQMLECTVLLT